MKKLVKVLFIAAMMIAPVACNSSDGYVLKGTVKGDNSALQNGKAILSNHVSSCLISDTVDVVNGEFTFKGNVETPEVYYLTVDGLEGAVKVLLENDKYTLDAVADSFAQAKIVGGESNTLMYKGEEEADKFYEDSNAQALIDEYQAPGTSDERKEEIAALMQDIQEKADAINDNLAKENPLTPFALSVLSNKSYYMEPEELVAALEPYQNDPKFANNRIVKRLADGAEKSLATAVGKKAVDFTLNNPDDKPVTLSDVYKNNKVTMIDFWASWCGPCRRFNPSLVKIYKEFHDKGFEIVGVSLDNKKDAWTKAISDDSLTWINVSDLKGWESGPASNYGIKYIPQNVFISADGTIIAKRLEEEEIAAFLTEQLSK